ncbi:LPXTG cell wall anchor domain-containing protein [Streptomyces sp. NPDC032161]
MPPVAGGTSGTKQGGFLASTGADIMVAVGLALIALLSGAALLIARRRMARGKS